MHERPRPETRNDILALIIKSTCYGFVGSWHLHDDVIQTTDEQTGLQLSYDYLLNINGQNHLVHPDDHEKIFELFQADAEPENFEIQIITSTGEIKLLTGSGKFARDAEENSSPTLASQKHSSNSLISGSQRSPSLKTYEPRIQQNTELLESVMQSDITALSVLRPVYDEKNQLMDFEWVVANRLLMAIAGGRPVVGKRYTAMFPSSTTDGSLALMKQVMITGERRVREYYHQDANIQGWFRGIYVRANDLIIVSAEDITSEKRSRQELLKNYQIIEQTEAVAGAGSWEFIPSRDEFTWSKGMYRIFGLKDDTIIKPEIYLDIAINEDQDIAKRIVSKLRDELQPFEEIIRININGKKRTIKILANVVFDQQGRPWKVLGIDFDITALRESDRLRELNNKLNELDRAKTKFFTNVSHEFRTPLTLILGPLQDLIKKGIGSGSEIPKLEMAYRNGMRLMKLVNMLLDFAIMEAGKSEAIFQPTDIASFTSDSPVHSGLLLNRPK